MRTGPEDGARAEQMVLGNARFNLRLEVSDTKMLANLCFMWHEMHAAMAAASYRGAPEVPKEED